MAWVRVDDHFDEHPKFAKAGPLGIALWLAGLAYCNRNLTNGFIPWAKARSLVSWDFLGPETNAEGMHKMFTVGVTSGMVGEDVEGDFVCDLLCRAGLWEQVDGGYRIHDYLDYQPSREDVQRERARNADRQARHRSSNGVTNTVTAGVTNTVSATVSNAGPVPNPVPNTGVTPLTPQGAKRRPVPKPKPERTPVTDQDIEDLVGKYAERYGGRQAVRDEIELALNHTARFKSLKERLYVDGWLRRELEHRPGWRLINGRSPQPQPIRHVIDRTGVAN